MTRNLKWKRRKNDPSVRKIWYYPCFCSAINSAIIDETESNLGRGKPDGAVTSASEVEDDATPAADELNHPHVEYDPDPVVIDSKTSAKAQPSKKVATWMFLQ